MGDGYGRQERALFSSQMHRRKWRGGMRGSQGGR